MLKVISNEIRSPELEVNVLLTPIESKVFAHIKKVCELAPDLYEKSARSLHPPVSVDVPITARIAGGWVRDKLLPMYHPDIYVKPPKDIDIALDLVTGEEFSSLLESFDQIYKTNAFTRGEDRGESAASVAVSFTRIFGADVEFLQLRKESYGREGDRHSVAVEKGNPWQDAFRRDLTINSMFYNINTGKVEDYTQQGEKDLATLTLRTPTRPGFDEDQEVLRIFKEDPIRVLRILRFHGRYEGAKIYPAVLRGMQNPEIQSLITRKIFDHSLTKSEPGTPPEKVSEEFKKIMSGRQPAESVQILYQIGLLEKILGIPTDYAPLNSSQKNKHHDLTVMDHIIKTMENLNNMALKNGENDEIRMMLNFSALFHDIGKLDPKYRQNKPSGEMSYHGHELGSLDRWKAFAKSMKLGNRETDFVSNIVSAHMKPHDLLDVDNESLLRFVNKHPRWKYIFMHAEADSQAKKQTDAEVAKKYETVRSQRIPGFPGMIQNPYRDPQSKGYDPELADSEYILPSLYEFIKPGEIINLIKIRPESKPIPGQGLPRNYIQFIADRFTEKQYKGWVPSSKDEIVQFVLNQRPDVFSKYGPRVSADTFRFLPEFEKLPPQYINKVKNRIQESLYQNPNLSTEEQQNIARSMKNELYKEYGLFV